MAGNTRVLDVVSNDGRTGQIELKRQIEKLFINPLAHELLDSVPDCVLVLDQQRKIVFTNEALLGLVGAADTRALYGLRPGDVLGCIHATDVSGGCGESEFCRTCGALRAILSSLRGEEAVQECRITQRNGDALDLRVWTRPLDIDGETYSAFAVQDISHEKRRRALERVFFHDMLNTMGGMLGFVSLLESAPPEERDELMEEIERLTEQMISDIRAQQSLVQAEAGDLVVDLQPVHALNLLHELVDLYSHHEIAAGRTLKIARDACSTSFASDPNLLRRVLGNMIKNALEASELGQTVTVTCYTAGNEVVFSVHNDRYMPRHVQLQIFQRSFTTKGAGRGLGTYGMKLLTERYLHGRIGFVTSVEQGTTFSARYPLKPRVT